MLIKGGKLITADTIEEKDIKIEKGKIKSTGVDLKAYDGEEVIDASGMLIFPGIIDSHTHFKLRSRGTVTVDDFYRGGRSAALGGVTTHLDYADMVDGSMLMGLEERLIDAREAVIDYHFHLVVNNDFDPEKGLQELKILRNTGISSLKAFTTYQGMYMLDTHKWLTLFRAAKDAGLLVTVHAEKDELIQQKIKLYRKKNKTGIEYHPDIRPGVAEAEAIRGLCDLALKADSPLYIVHLSSKEGYKEVKKAREKGLKLYVETTPHYLLLTRELLKGKEGRLNMMTPPLREEDDNQVLWQGVRDGVIDVIATDHCAFSKEQKNKGSDALDTLPGIPGVETMLPLIYTYGVKSGKITVKRMVELLSTNPARIFGLYPQKGSLKPGTDADLVIFNPDLEIELNDKTTHSRAGYTPYQGFRVKGMPATIILRGKVIVKDREFIGEKGYGEFIEAKESSVK